MKVQIAIDLSSSSQKYVDVTYKVTQIDADHLVFSFPTWSPGSYLIREYQNQVEGFRVEGRGGKKLKAEKISKCEWKVKTAGNNTAKLTYRIYANDLNVRGIYADHQMVFVNPTSAFFFIKGQLDLPVEFRIRGLKKWNVAFARRGRKQLYRFSHFDEFYDEPLLCAKELDVHRFTQNKTKYKVAIWGHHVADVSKILKDIKDVVAKENHLFRSNPCKEYVFQIIFAPNSYGGLEHSYASTNIFDGSLLNNKKDYQRFISLLSHEHFHLWNVKRIRPRGLGPFDYTKESYTKDLWIAEGITSYYDDHFLLRSGLYSVDEYLGLVGENITKLQANKNVRVNSLSESSFDAWIRFYRQNENSINTTVSYYLKGGLVSMLLDFRIIKASRGKKTFDDLLRKLFALYNKRPEIGITREEFFEQVQEVADVDCSKFNRDYIDGLKAIDWKKEFSEFGIDVKTSSKGSRYLGVVLQDVQGKIFIHSVAEDSPAYHSMLQAKDEIIAVNGRRLTAVKDLDLYLSGETLKVLFCRMGQVFETEFALDGKGRVDYTLQLKKKMSATQKRNLRCFLRSSG